MILTIACVLLLAGCGASDQNTISMDPSMQVTVPEDPDGTEDPDEGALTQTPKTGGEIYLVMSIDTEKRLIGLGLPDSARTIQYGYSKATQILDDHGQFMSAGKLTPGRAVTLGALDDEAKLTVIQLAEEAWYQENITRFSIDPTIGMLTIGDTKYRYGDHLRVFSGDQEISLEQVGENDVISVQGLEKQILSVQVTTGHGTIALTNTELFEGGWISLGTKIYAKITPDMLLEVPEGTYELSVANDGYGDSKTVEVARAQITTVDLNEYKGEGPKTCMVTFEIHVEGAQLFINGDPIEYEDPVELRYGVYQLMVIADGFETWERQLVIHSKEATIQIGEPQLTEDTEAPEEEPDEQETDTDTDTEDASQGADDEAGDQSVTSDDAQTGTDAEALSDSSTGDYSDYLDTITDLIASLVRLKNE
ncbi:MAG: hypothetical protein PUK75_09260 [bacterium]|nr:hypothetical protein [bacterium]MDY4101244.1 hypothetical protein [Lachnospiraceae bacterium]